MKNMLIITCAFLVGAQMESSVHTVKGHIGGKAVIECPYPPGCEHRQKYVCRGDCPPGNKDIPVQTAVSQVWAKTGRFSLHDNATARVFTVTITGLTAKDSGKYWCAVQFPWYNSDLYTELRIDIGPAPVTTLSPAIITGASTVLTFSPVSVVCSVAVVIVVLLSMLGVLIYFRKAKHKRTETTDAVFLYTSGCSSSNIYVETGGSAVEMGHSVPTVIQQHQNPTTTSSSITTTSSPSSSSSTVPSAPPQVYEVPESLYQRMAPLACGKIPVPRDSSPSARTADGAEYMSMQDCARAADGAEYT
ncbi:CMRF35-like molecule 5 isoform X2 [Alosa sapidissima]|uniref:CMRF35-like molecule 5 isoform X2 n=1 Tax=Alosa sapidissima TaxID=34773 RepID=UPI001C08432A|nr:CMRF35-like molecule 5 isoform X2 [Alosa sapidissima]